MKELLLGCGNRRVKDINVDGNAGFTDVVTVDINPMCSPDVVMDLQNPYWANKLLDRDYVFDEVHAYEILEHVGEMGSEIDFFDTFRNIWMVLKEDGYLMASVPSWNSVWAWGDPGHKRIINEGSLAFLDQNEYERQVGKTPMSDYRFSYWPTPYHFERVWMQHDRDRFYFVLQKKTFPETSSSSETTHTTQE